MMRVVASILVGLLASSCGTGQELRRPASHHEALFLPNAPRAVASPAVEVPELRKAVEELLPHIDVEAPEAELRRLLADPRFHGHRPEELQVVLAGWGSGPAHLEEITRGYRAWCDHAKQSECLARTLSDSDVYQLAFDFALGSQWDGFVKEVKSTIDPGTIRAVLLAGIVIFMASIAFPELASKIPAAAATLVLTASIGARAVFDLIFGWIQMVGALDAATSFEQVRAAGVRYGEKIGVQTARILILLATAAIAEGGLIARLMKLPHAAEASAALATESGGLGLEAIGRASGVRVSAGGVAITLMAVRLPPPTGQPPSLDGLSKAAGVADRGGLTAAGRSLTKHGAGARPGNSLFPQAQGSPSQINQQAQDIVDDVLRNPHSTFTTSHRGRFGDTLEVTAPDGRGIVYDANGNFLFFKE